jgi:hypothetical protein
VVLMASGEDGCGDVSSFADRKATVASNDTIRHCPLPRYLYPTVKSSETGAGYASTVPFLSVGFRQHRSSTKNRVIVLLCQTLGLSNDAAVSAC